MSTSIKVQMTYIVETIKRIEVEIPISSLTYDEEGMFDFDNIQEVANASAIKNMVDIEAYKNSNFIIDECEIVESSIPDDFSYWH